MKFRDVAEKATQRNFPKTSQPCAQDFMDVYEKLKGEGVITILPIHLSHELSGTINSANIGSGMVDEIDEKIIDSHRRNI
ncbi:MAG: DegV family protein [Candidatus Heimdallarchaeota archaeon]|nr:DegV family protein [Candidatus Heimdallarchaeota archaeon]